MASLNYLSGPVGTRVAEEHSGGLFPRREALRTLAALGIAGVSGSLLAACEAPDPAPHPGAATPPPGRGLDTPRGSDVRVGGPTGTLRGAWAAPAGPPRASVLVLHDNQGLTPHFSDLVGRFAGAGYATLCVDLLSDRTPTAARAAPADAGLGELARRAPGTKIGAVGFGYGAGLLWQRLAAGEPRLAAAVAFYGLAPDDPDFRRSHAAVLGLYPENDRKLTESQDNADLGLVRANLVHASAFYPDTAVGFFNDTGPRYNPGAAAQAWRATLDWLRRYL